MTPRLRMGLTWRKRLTTPSGFHRSIRRNGTLQWCRHSAAGQVGSAPHRGGVRLCGCFWPGSRHARTERPTAQVAVRAFLDTEGSPLLKSSAACTR
jgi:hypothetical protein